MIVKQSLHRRGKRLKKTPAQADKIADLYLAFEVGLCCEGQSQVCHYADVAR
jgi:hypothetical protein